MPVGLLLVEGTLDAEVLGAILAGACTVAIGGPKGSLHHRARQIGDDRKIEVRYVRDRDFDFDPPPECSCPVDDELHYGLRLGWRWCRHEIENYLLEPALVCQAMKWAEGGFSAALVGAAQRIRHYQIARWVVGVARRSLPPLHELATRPSDFRGHDFRLPDDLGPACTQSWARKHVSDFRERVAETLSAGAVDFSFRERAEILTEQFLQSPVKALVWCSGKDLFAGLATWLREQKRTEPHAFRARLRDWVRDNANEAMTLLPEWHALRAQVSG